MNHWKKIIGYTRQRQQNLLSVFMTVIDLSYHTSTRQVVQRRAAEEFYRKRLLIISWLCFCYDRVRAKEVDALLPLAARHANKAFFDRVVRMTFGGFIAYHKIKMYKARLMKRADRGRRRILLSSGVKRLLRHRLKLLTARQVSPFIHLSFMNHSCIFVE